MFDYTEIINHQRHTIWSEDLIYNQFLFTESKAKEIAMKHPKELKWIEK